MAATRRPASLTFATAALVAYVSGALLFTVEADECGTRFTDPTSSTVRAHAVVMGSVMDWNPTLRNERTRSANVSVEKVYKGENVVDSARAGGDRMIMVSQFGHEDKDSCVASDTDMSREKKHIFFLRRSHHRGMLQISAMPLPMDTRMERRIRRSLCDTCVRPPHIKRLMCRDCAQAPKMRDMKPRKVIMGRRVRLRCVARAKPQPSFSWSKNGIPITTGSGGITIRSTATTSTLMIRSTSGAHAGQYKCTASNDVGTAETVATVELTTPPRRPKYTVRTAPDQEPCANQNLCFNGGSCIYSPSLDLSFCLCPQHFLGARCQTLNASAVIDERRETSTVEDSSSEQPRTSQQTTERRRGRQNEDRTVSEASISPQQQTPRTASNNFRSTGRSRTQKETVTADSQAPAISTQTTTLESAASAPETSSVSQGSASSRRQTHGRDSSLGARRRPSVNYNELQTRLRKTNLKIIHCRKKGYCLNGGRCRYIPKQKFQFCQCRSGYTGKRCEQITSLGVQ